MYKGKLLTGAVLSVFMAGAYGNACAADGTSDAVYSLNPVVVTATRYEKSDAEIPAATQTFTEEQIEQTGADNLQVALQYLDGVIDAGMGPNGTSVSSMTTKNVIRGVSNGTVVMINGTPINWRTNYNLENIPTSAVERVEVVRGGGAVLYGSQATGGVINIITKKTLPNEVKVGLGNKGRLEYAVAANAGDLSIAYTYNKWGKLGYVSSSDSSIKPDKTRVPVEMKQRFFGSEKNDFLATYKLNDHADFLYNHNESASRWAYTYTGITDPDYEDMNDHPRYIRRYENDKDFLQFNFHGLDGISGHVFYNYNTLKTHGTDYYSSTGKKYAAPKAVRGQEKNKTYGYDVQKVWDGNPDQTFLIGTSLVRETFENETSDTGRNIISAFGSWERNLTAKDVLTLSGRGTWTTGGIQNFHNFSGQAQYLHKLDNTQSLYASVGQSFVLPTFSQMYSREQAGGISNIIGNPDLKPQKGLHYEAGWKKEETNRQYKVALFTEKSTTTSPTPAPPDAGMPSTKTSRTTASKPASEARKTTASPGTQASHGRTRKASRPQKNIRQEILGPLLRPHPSHRRRRLRKREMDHSPQLLLPRRPRPVAACCPFPQRETIPPDQHDREILAKQIQRHHARHRQPPEPQRHCLPHHQRLLRDPKKLHPVVPL